MKTIQTLVHRRVSAHFWFHVPTILCCRCPRRARQWTLTSNAAGPMWSCSLVLAFLAHLCSIGEEWIRFSFVNFNVSCWKKWNQLSYTQNERYCFCQPTFRSEVYQPILGKRLDAAYWPDALSSSWHFWRDFKNCLDWWKNPAGRIHGLFWTRSSARCSAHCFLLWQGVGR